MAMVSCSRTDFLLAELLGTMYVSKTPANGWVIESSEELDDLTAIGFWICETKVLSLFNSEIESGAAAKYSRKAAYEMAGSIILSKSLFLEMNR